MLIISLITNLLNIIKVKTLKCMSVTNQQCKSRPKIIDVNTVSEPVYYPYSVLINKCSGSCNDLNDPMAKLCVPDITNSINMKVYNLLMQANETKNISWHETCKCVCRLTSAVCNKSKFGIVICVLAIVITILLIKWFARKDICGIQVFVYGSVTCGVNQVNI